MPSSAATVQGERRHISSARTLIGPDLLAAQAALSASLDLMEPRGLCTWPLALAFNELLDAANEEIDGDPVLAAIPRLRPATTAAVASTDCATVSALASQIRLALTSSSRQ